MVRLAKFFFKFFFLAESLMYHVKIDTQDTECGGIMLLYYISYIYQLQDKNGTLQILGGKYEGGVWM